MNTGKQQSAGRPAPLGRKVPVGTCVIGWQAMDLKRLWNDCTQLLVAVPVASRIPQSPKRSADDDWYYEFSVVVIRCDEGYFEIETTEGDAWGWELDSVDFYVILSE